MAEYERPKETAARLAVDVQTIYEWCRAGYFPDAIRGPKKGSTIRIPKDAAPVFTPPTTTRRKIRRTR